VVPAHQAKTAPIRKKTGRRSALPSRAAQRTADHPRCPAAEANGTSIILTIPATEADQPDVSHQGLGEGDGLGLEERRWKSLQPSNGHFRFQALVGGIEPGNDRRSFALSGKG